MPTFFVQCDVEGVVDDDAISTVLAQRTATAGLAEAFRADVRVRVSTALQEIVEALYADRTTGELTGQNTIPERSCADFVEAVSAILDAHGLTPDGIPT